VECSGTIGVVPHAVLFTGLTLVITSSYLIFQSLVFARGNEPKFQSKKIIHKDNPDNPSITRSITAL